MKAADDDEVFTLFKTNNTILVSIYFAAMLS